MNSPHYRYKNFYKDDNIDQSISISSDAYVVIRREKKENKFHLKEIKSLSSKNNKKKEEAFIEVLLENSKKYKIFGDHQLEIYKALKHFMFLFKTGKWDFDQKIYTYIEDKKKQKIVPFNLYCPKGYVHRQDVLNLMIRRIKSAIGLDKTDKNYKKWKINKNNNYKLAIIIDGKYLDK